MNITILRALRIVCLIIAVSLLLSCGADKKKYIGQWRAVNAPPRVCLSISDNGSNLLIHDPIQPDTFTATIDSTGDLQDSHGRKLPYIKSRNHLLYLSMEYEKVSDSPQ